LQGFKFRMDIKINLVLAILIGLGASRVMRTKRQIFRHEIPRHRPLTGATYHHHAGFPHPGRFNENSVQFIPPNPTVRPTPGPELYPGDIPDNPLVPHDDNHLGSGFITSLATLQPAFPNTGSFLELDHNELDFDGPVSWSTRNK